MSVCDQLAVFASQSLKKNSCKPQLTVHCTMAWAKKTDMDGLQWNQETTKDYHFFMYFLFKYKRV